MQAAADILLQQGFEHHRRQREGDHKSAEHSKIRTGEHLSSHRQITDTDRNIEGRNDGKDLQHR